MKPSPQENPDLTAYAVGELEARQAREIHDLLAGYPAAVHELEQVEAVTDALRQGAPIPQDRLRPEQRHAVLYPANLPRRVTPLMPRALPKRPSAFRPVLTSFLKAAAVVAVAGTAYMVGRNSELDQAASGAGLAASEPVKAEENTSPAPVVAEVTPTAAEKTLASAATPAAPQEVAEPAPVPAPVAAEKPEVVVVAAPVPAPVAPAPVQAVAEIKTVPVVAKAPAAPHPSPIFTPGKHQNFVNASRQAVDQFSLRPSQLRPLPVKLDKNQVLAAPLPAQQVPENKEVRPRTPDLYIHSWKADIATCPWNDAHRLLRVTVQLPADQPAALSQASYPLRVTFDPNNVREYRQLCERHQPASELRSAGTHVVWYEFMPNGDADVNKTVATVTLDKGRFTTQTVGPFDSTKLNVQDRGVAWQNAREDFVFDSAVVGFGLLMRGMPQAPNLNHALVLSLAEKAKGIDASGDHAKFIRLVKDAAKAAGL